MSELVDDYVRRNRIALEVFYDSGHSPFHGVDRRILRALGRRGLVWWDHEWRGGLTDRGRAALAEMEDDE